MRKYFLLLLIPLTFGCGEYNKVLKDPDHDYRFAKAKEYYENDDCYRALPIFEELIALWRGTQKIEEVQYYYAQTHYCIGDYYLANYYFKNFAKTYNQSEFAEECLFMAAMCNYQLSPQASLDQEDTKSAIEEFEIFMNRYPLSSRVDTCNYLMGQLKMKLEKKEFDIASLYAKTEQYKSATIMLNQLLEDYPSTVYAEEVMFMLVKNSFLFAEQSIDSKKKERYEACTKSYYNFVGRFPESKFVREAESYFNRSLKALDRLTVANE